MKVLEVEFNKMVKKHKKQLQFSLLEGQGKRIILGLIVLYTLVFSISLISASNWTSELNTGLVGYWNFAEGSGTTTADVTGQQPAGILSNASWTTGKIRNGISFNGSSNSILKVNPLTQNFTQTSPISFSFWWKGGSASSLLIGVNKEAISWVADWEGFNLLAGDKGGGNMTPEIVHGKYDTKLAYTNTNFIYNNWTHYVIVYNGTVGTIADWNYKIYQNGIDISPPTQAWWLNQSGTPSYTVDSFTLGNFWGSGVDVRFNHTGNFSEVGLWNRTLNITEVAQLYNSGSGITYPTSSVNITYPLNAIYIINVSTINYTIINMTGSRCWYSNSSGVWNSTTVPAGNNFTSVVSVDGSNTWTVYCNDTATSDIYSDSVTFTKGRYATNSETYNAQTTEGAIENFILNINISGLEGFSSAYLNYNNTNYSASVAVSGDNYIISRQLNIPSVSANTVNTFFWYINFDSGTDATTSHNQTVINFAIDNCSSQTMKIINFTLVSEKLQAVINSLNSTVEIDLNIYPIGSGVSIINYSGTFSNVSSGAVCLGAGSLNTTNYTMDVQIKYVAEGYTTEYYNIQGYALNKNTIGNNITLYDLLTTENTNFIINFKDSNYLPVANALIVIKRKYVGEGVYKTVEIPMTDNYGSATGHFDKNGVLYSITVIKNGVILGTFDNIFPKCQDILTETCNINLNAVSSSQPFTDFGIYKNMAFTMTFNQTTRKVSVYFITTDGTVTTVSVNVTKFNNAGNLSVCFNSLTSSSGSFDCLVPATYGNLTIIASLYKDGVFVTSQVFTITPDSKDIFGYEGIILMIILLLTIPLMFISSPIGIIVGIIIGIVVAIFLGIFNAPNVLGTASSLIWLIVTGGIIVWKLSTSNKGGGL